MQIATAPALTISPQYSGAASWVVAPADREAFDRWIECRDRWLDSVTRRSHAPNTRRAYAADWLKFFAYWRQDQLMPWHVTTSHVQNWAAAMETAGSSPSTVNRRLAALSSFYTFAARYGIPTPAGEVMLWERPNPCAGVQRAHIDPYEHAVYPTVGQVHDLLAAIPLTTPQGWRDLALLAGMFVTTRRVSEWIRLRWRDLHGSQSDGRWFTYRYKGGKTKRQRIPPDLWRIVERSLEIAGRLPMQPDDYLFSALGAVAKPVARPGLAPISAHQVNTLLKRYGRRAGIPEDRLHAHALRHAGARARDQAGSGLMELRDVLGHASIAVTQIYTERVLDVPEDALGDTILAQVLPHWRF